MDLFALRYWKPSTWSKPDLVLLLPGLVAGIGIGYLMFRFLDHRAIAIAMAASTLLFVGLWLAGGAQVAIRPRSTPKAIGASLASSDISNPFCCDAQRALAQRYGRVWVLDLRANR